MTVDHYTGLTLVGLGIVRSSTCDAIVRWRGIECLRRVTRTASLKDLYKPEHISDQSRQDIIYWNYFQVYY